MSVEVNKRSWAKVLKFFSDQNKGRLTRLGVFEGGPGASADFCIENGMKLVGIDADAHDETAATVQIMLGSESEADAPNFTHIVRCTQRVKLHFSPDGSKDSVEIEDAEGKTTVLRLGD